MVASEALILELSEEDPRVWKGDEGSYAPSFTPASSDTESYGAWHDVFPNLLKAEPVNPEKYWSSDFDPG